MAHEAPHIFAVLAPSMNWAVTMVNDDASAHLLLHIVPHGSEPGHYWLVFKADSRLRRKFDDLAKHGQVLE
jgi:hypothetical protein